MNTFKTQFLALQATVHQLSDKLQKLEGTTPATPDCHYVSSEQESGELSLDCMDTFRFIYTTPPNQTPGYNAQQQHWIKYPTCYTYSLINPNEDLINYHKTHAKLHNAQYSEYAPNNPDCGLQIKTETPPDQLEQSEFQLCMHNNHNPDFKIMLPKTKEMKDVLAEKFFTYSKDSTAGFMHTETILFKQEYEILPHISFFLTPLDKHNLLCKITDITKKSVTFELKYVNPTLNSSPDAILHWQVQGVRKIEPHSDLLG